MVPAPTTQHQRILRNLNSILQRHIEHHNLGEVLFAPVDVILGQGDLREVVQPDLIFVAAHRREIIKLHGIEGPPDLVVEILSRGTEVRDRGYKLTMYVRHGVPEYWIVDPESRTVDAYRPESRNHLTPLRYGEHDVMTCPLLADLKIPLRNLFAD